MDTFCWQLSKLIRSATKSVWSDIHFGYFQYIFINMSWSNIFILSHIFFLSLSIESCSRIEEGWILIVVFHMEFWCKSMNFFRFWVSLVVEFNFLTWSKFMLLGYRFQWEQCFWWSWWWSIWISNNLIFFVFFFIWSLNEESSSWIKEGWILVIDLHMELWWKSMNFFRFWVSFFWEFNFLSFSLFWLFSLWLKWEQSFWFFCSIFTFGCWFFI